MTKEEAKELIIYLMEQFCATEDDMKACDTAIKALDQEPKSPCDVCRFNPPSSCDGKPCTMCPAESEEK